MQSSEDTSTPEGYTQMGKPAAPANNRRQRRAKRAKIKKMKREIDRKIAVLRKRQGEDSEACTETKGT